MSGPAPKGALEEGCAKQPGDSEPVPNPQTSYGNPSGCEAREPKRAGTQHTGNFCWCLLLEHFSALDAVVGAAVA